VILSTEEIGMGDVGETDAAPTDASATGAPSSAGGPGGATGAPTADADPSHWPEQVAPAPLEGIAPSQDSAAPFRSVGFRVSSTGYAASRGFRDLLAPLGLDPREFALLRAVSFAEGHSQQAIGERLKIPPSRMVAFVDALEERGLLERRQNPHDRRARELYLTASGRDLLDRAVAVAVGHERNLCADLSGEEREQLLSLLQRVGERLGVPADAHAAHSALTDG
jgi:DNA-binding MarR family transcriptional regulator